MRRTYLVFLVLAVVLAGSCSNNPVSSVDGLDANSLSLVYSEDAITPVYVDDVMGAFTRIDAEHRRRHIDAWTYQGFTFNYGTTQHIQGIARFPQSNYFAVSGNPSDEARVAIVKIASRPGDYLLGSNGCPPPHSDQMVRLITLSTKFGHAGGLSTCGNILAVPIEGDTIVTITTQPYKIKVKQSEIRFLFAPPDDIEGIYDLADDYPAAVIKRSYGGDYTILRGAGVVALTRLPTGAFADHYLVAVYGGGRSGQVTFYVSKTTQITDGFNEASFTISDWFKAGLDAAMQNINFIVQPGGEIYLFGSCNTYSSGGQHDYGYLARVVFPDDNPYREPVFSSINNKHFHCDDNYGNFTAASGIYISSDGKLALYASIHSTHGESNGPAGFTEVIKITEFPWALTPPTADAGPDQIVSAGPDCTAMATLDGSASYDADGDPLTYVWTWDTGSVTGVGPTIQLPLGTTVITLVVNDGMMDSEPDSMQVTVVDDTPPEMILSVDREMLWPPNHKMCPVTITVTAFDNCDPEPYSRIISVISNEPDDGSGDGRTSPDWEITGDLTVELRAERSGKGKDRVYTIEVECTDKSGNSTIGSVDVIVPHDRSV